MTMRRMHIGAVIGALSFLVWAVLLPVAAAQGSPSSSAAEHAPRIDATTFDYGLRARALAPGVYVVDGANADFAPTSNGCNIINTGFITTGAGVVVINTGPSRRYGEQLRALIARTTDEPVVQVVHLNLHPDYFLGNQAFAEVPRRATALTQAGMQREAAGYATNLYRLCGDWMKGTEVLLPDTTIAPGPWRIGARVLELRELRGHTDSDLVLIDTASGVAFAGGLVFADRIPTTPHAQIDAWLTSLRALVDPQIRVLVPSHGPVRNDTVGLEQTRHYLNWLDGAFRDAASRGLDMNELLRAPVPDEFRNWAAFATEYTRNVAHLYPRYELAPLRGPAAR
jgi:quinoprotein relay system zinc metallohydrolase 1